MNEKNKQIKTSVNILHFGDLFFHRDVNTEKCLERLLNDIAALGHPPIDFMVFCGDYGWNAYPGDFHVCKRFIEDLARALNVRLEMCLFVPGNHDVDWSYQGAYSYRPFIHVDGLSLEEREKRHRQETTEFYRIEDKYGRRFGNFGEFYKGLTGKKWVDDISLCTIRTFA